MVRPHIPSMIMTPRVMLGFDMETDVGSWTPYYEGIVHGTPRVLDVLDKHAITSTFYFVASAAQQHPAIVKQVDRAGHDVGCHTLFHETIGDELFPIPGITPILPHECGPRIKLATEIMSKIVGYMLTWTTYGSWLPGEKGIGDSFGFTFWVIIFILFSCLFTQL